MDSKPITKEIPDGGSFTYVFIGVEKLEDACERARQAHWRRMKLLSDQEGALLEDHSRK